MRISKLLLSAGIFIMPLTASATDANKYYLSLTGEYIASAKADGDISALGISTPAQLDYKNGWGGMLSVGYYIMPEIRSELEVGYREFKGDTSSVTIDNITYTVDASDLKDKALTGMGNLYYDIPTSTSITPYIGGGIGIAHQTNNGNGNAFAFQGMAGLNYKIDATNTIYAGYRYFGTSDFKTNYSISGIDVTQKTNIEAHSVDIGYRFNF